MRITTCSRCGKMIHIADNCMYCGAKIDRQINSEEYPVHENVYDEFFSIFKLLETKDFAHAIDVANTVLKWMPTCAEVFWIKMLAKNKCRDDTELVRKGVLLRSTPEFLNAIKYASDHELAVYKEIERVIDNVKKD